LRLFFLHRDFRKKVTQRTVPQRTAPSCNATQCKTSFEKSATQRYVPQYSVSQRNAMQDQFREIRNETYRVEPYHNSTNRNKFYNSISLRQAATTPADFASRNFHAMFFDKRKITCGTFRCGPVRCRFIRSTFWKRNSACGTLRCGTEFSRKDFVKREKTLRYQRCVALPSCGNPAYVYVLTMRSAGPLPATRPVTSSLAA